MTAKSRKQKESNLLWHALSSMKLTLALLIILAFTSVFGTLIPQQQEAMRFAQGLSPGLLRFFQLLGLFDLYHSFWFRAIIALLALNLVICSINRLPTALKLFRAPSRLDRTKPFENLTPERRFLLKGGIEDIQNRAADCLRRRFRRVEIKSAPERSLLYGEKGRYSYFGVYFVHLGVLIILMGGIIGSLFGFEAYVNIPEGDTVDSVHLRGDMAPMKLGFSVHCERFSVQYYDNGTPKEYKSDLRFLTEGIVSKRGSVLVNHPITFNGITFYQSTFGSIPDKVHLKIRKEGFPPEESTIEIELGRIFSLPGSDAQVQILDADDNYRGMMGPAVLISVKPLGAEEIRFLAFKDLEILRRQYPEAMFQSPMLNASVFKPYTFLLENLETRYYTGLQANRDPGVPLVWVGCFVMVAGLFVTFFASHRKVWISLSGAETEVNISVAGKANRNPVGLEKELDQVTDELRYPLIEEESP
jgi:cytochrome c biogenesis protein